MYAFAVTAWETLYRAQPWDGLGIVQLISNVRSNKRPAFDQRLPVKPWVQDLIAACWSADAAQRPTTEDVLERFQSHESGATLAAALLVLGRVKGVERPALLVEFPSLRGRTFLLDGGANADCRPSFLVQFAAMGLAYAEASGALAPRVGLLSIGEEEGKGNALVQEAYPLLRAALGERFYGNVEGRDIFLGTTEVVVTDGFTGNVALKLAEGEARVLLTWIKEALTSSFRARLGALLVREALARVKARVDPAQYGAMPLLGVEGAVFIGHGSADALAVKNALLRAKAMVEAGLLARVRQRLSALHV
mgnify:CR=1 FL=1